MRVFKPRPSQSPLYPDILEEGPPLSAGLCRLSRDDARYWQRRLPRDHDDDGVLHGGPNAEDCVLEPHVGFTYCAVSAPTPDNTRKQEVTYRGRKIAEARDWQRNGADPNDPKARLYEAILESIAPQRHTQHSGYGLYGRPRKPAASGRRKKSA